MVPAIPTVDKLIWLLDSKGNFSVKAALKSSQPHLNANPEANWKALWKLKLHDRFKILIWRTASGVLPTKLNFAQKVGFGDTHCPFCLDEEESLEYLFFKCHISRAIWFGSMWALRSDLISLSTCKDFIKFVCEPPISTPATMGVNILNASTSIQFALTLDCIWNLRNKVSYSDHKINILSTVKALDIKIWNIYVHWSQLMRHWIITLHAGLPHLMMLLNLMLTLLLFLIKQPFLWWLAIPKELFLMHG